MNNTKKICFLIFFLIFIIFLSGCGFFNLYDFILPDDIEFLQLVQSLKTPEEICRYMRDNFECEYFPFKTLSPYELYLTKKGDCDIFATFATYIANYHGYETYQIKIKFRDTFISHCLAVYVENNKGTFSSNLDYFSFPNDTFSDIVEYFTNNYESYEVYDYQNNLIEKVQK